MTYPTTTRDHYYVAARAAGRGTALAVGPYRTHSDAARHVETVRVWSIRNLQRAQESAEAHFADWGVAHVHSDEPPRGRLNSVLGALCGLEERT